MVFGHILERVLVKCGIAEYRCGMGIGLGLELGSGVRVWVMARAYVVFRVCILLCSSIA